MRIAWSVVGIVVLMGCGTPVNSGTGGGAGADGGSSGGGGALCNDNCASQARAGCAQFSMGACVSTCNAQFAAAPSCAALFEAALRCSASATYMCNADDRAVTASCTMEGVAAVSCMSAAADAGM